MKLILIVVALLAGCATTPAPIVDNAAAQRAVFDAEGKYRLALIVANAYVKLPLCENAQPPCATLSVVRTIQKAQPAARAILDSAEQTVRTPGFGNEIYSSAVTAAFAGVDAFQKITDQLPK